MTTKQQAADKLEVFADLLGDYEQRLMNDPGTRQEAAWNEGRAEEVKYAYGAARKLAQELRGHSEVSEETREQAVDRMINEYTRNLNRKLKENMERVPEGVFGKDGFIIRWMGQEITRDDAPSILRVGKSIKEDMLYYELSL